MMGELNVDISGHTPRSVTRELAAWADLIIPVERGLGERLVECFPCARGKIRNLTRDVKDPMCENTLPAYRRARNELREELAALVAELTR